MGAGVPPSCLTSHCVSSLLTISLATSSFIMGIQFLTRHVHQLPNVLRYHTLYPKPKSKWENTPSCSHCTLPNLTFKLDVSITNYTRHRLRYVKHHSIFSHSPLVSGSSQTPSPIAISQFSRRPGAIHQFTKRSINLDFRTIDTDI